MTTPSAIVTGANSGIGLETTRALAAKGYRTFLLCRNEGRAQAAVADIRTTVPDAELQIVLADLGLQASVRAAATTVTSELDRLDVLVNNAGVTVRAPERTAEDHDLMLATNQLGPFLFTELLRPLLIATGPARVVNVASHAHRFAKSLDLEHIDAPTSYGWLGMPRYGATKLMNILWTRELARRLTGTEVTANAVHPGAVRSNLGSPAGWQKALVSAFMISAERGAQTSVFVATDPSVAGVNGGYWAKSARADAKLSSLATDDALAARLWDLCVTLTGR